MLGLALEGGGAKGAYENWRIPRPYRTGLSF